MEAVLRGAALEKAHPGCQGKSSLPLLSTQRGTTEHCAQFWPPHCTRDAKSNGSHKDGQGLEHRTCEKRTKKLHLFSLKEGEMEET